MTNVFTTGKTYAITGYNDTIKVVKRTDKSVWFEYAGETLRKKIHNVSSGEKIVLDGGSACVFPESVIEPQASVNEVETIEPQANNVVSLADYRANVEPQAITPSDKAEPIEDVESAEIISLDELDLIHLIQDLTLIELENANRKKLETLESDTTEILETLENPQDSAQDDSMNREDLIDRLAVIKMKRYKAFQNNWNTSKFDSEITEITDLLNQLNDRDTETITPSDNLNTLEISTSENLETLEFPQDSAQDLDKFEVTYQVLDCDDEVSYESRTVYANSKNHAKSIVIQSLQAQNLRFYITGCEYALLIDDLSDFAMAGYDEF